MMAKQTVRYDLKIGYHSSLSSSRTPNPRAELFHNIYAFVQWVDEKTRFMDDLIAKQSSNEDIDIARYYYNAYQIQYFTSDRMSLINIATSALADKVKSELIRRFIAYIEIVQRPFNEISVSNKRHEVEEHKWFYALAESLEDAVKKMIKFAQKNGMVTDKNSDDSAVIVRSKQGHISEQYAKQKINHDQSVYKVSTRSNPCVYVAS